MPQRKRKRTAVKSEPLDSDDDYDHEREKHNNGGSSDSDDEDGQGPAKRVQKQEGVKVEDYNEFDVVIELSDCDMEDIAGGISSGGGGSDPPQPAARSVRRSAGGRTPRRGTDVRALYEEVGVSNLPRSLAQVVKQEHSAEAATATATEPGASPLCVSGYARRAAALRAEQLLRGDAGIKEEGAVMFSAAANAAAVKDEGVDGTQVTENARRAAAVRAEQLLPLTGGVERVEGGEKTDSETSESVGTYRSPRHHLHAGKRKGGRVRTAEELAVLDAAFEQDSYPSRQQMERLAKELALRFRTIQYWYAEACSKVFCPDSTLLHAFSYVRTRCFRFAHARQRRGVNGGGRLRRFTAVDLAALEAAFAENEYPDRSSQSALAEKLGRTQSSIRSWFERRRRQQFTHEIPAPSFDESTERSLSALFSSNARPSQREMKSQARQLGLTQIDIQNWFFRERVKRGIPHVVRLSSEQTTALGAHFARDPYPDRTAKESLAGELGISVKAVGLWFRHERARTSIKLYELSPFTQEQRTALLQAFARDYYPDKAALTSMANRLGESTTRIRKWFETERRRVGTPAVSVDERARRICQFGPTAYDELVAAFGENPNPDIATKKALAESAGGTLKQITDWFLRRRKRVGVATESKARQKCAFGPLVYDTLVSEFEVDPCPSATVIEVLARNAGGTTTQIRQWFKYRRNGKRKRRGSRG